MMTLELKTTKRDINTKNKIIREGGDIPAVFYGQKSKSTPITINQADFKKVWKTAGESSVVTLLMDGKDIDVLIHDVALNPVTDEPIHSDFLVIDKNKKVTVKIPLEFIGESNAVKTLGGVLVKVVHELEVEAFPKDLPQKITVDLSALENLDSHISIGDLKISDDVAPTASHNEILVSVSVQKEEIEDVKPEADLSEIEVEKKGKKEDEGVDDKDNSESKKNK